MHPLVQAVVDAFDALAGWECPGEEGEQFAAEIRSLLGGIPEMFAAGKWALYRVGYALRDTPVVQDVGNCLEDVAEVLDQAATDDALLAWATLDAEHIERAEGGDTRPNAHLYNAPRDPRPAAFRPPAHPLTSEDDWRLNHQRTYPADERPPAPIDPVVPVQSTRPISERLSSGVDRRVRCGHSATAAEVNRVRLADGTTVIEKRTKDKLSLDLESVRVTAEDQQDAEEMVSAVLRALDVPAPEVYRTGPDHIYMTDMPGQIAADVLDRYPNVKIEDFTLTPKGLLIGCVDVMVSNWDRHQGNWLVDDDGTIYPIDHGLCFDSIATTDPAVPPKYLAPNIGGSTDHPFAAPYLTPIGVRTTHDPVTDRFITRAQTPEWADNPLHPEDAAEIRRRVAALRPEFERLGHEDWHDFMLARLDPIEKHAAATERTIWTATT